MRNQILNKKIEAMNKKGVINFSLLIFVLVFSLFNHSIAKASVTFEPLPENKVFNDFVVGPGKIEVELAPGESKTFELTLSNRLGTEKTFSVTEEDFVGSSNPKQTVVLLGNERGPYSLKDFIKLGTTSVDIPHATKSRISVTVSIPENAQPGGLYGSIIVGTVSKAGDTDSSTGIKTTNPIITRIGTLVFVRVSGPVKEEGKLTQLMIAGNRKFIFDSDSVIFDLLFENKGNVHLNPHGNIVVTNLLGSSVGTIEVDPWFAMPNSLRFREVEWKPVFLFGRYVAKASIARGYGDFIDEKEITFWVIPWKILASVIVGLIVVIGTIRFLFKRFKIERKR